MRQEKTTREVFEAWGRDYHADGMETEHWPRVRQMFDLIGPSDGDYLEVGVGNGYGLAQMATHQFAGGNCLGIDLGASMVRHARRRSEELDNVDVEVGDFLVWDFGGRLWVAVNFYAENEQSADWPALLGTPMQRWSKRDYAAGFERAGFEAIEQRMIAGP